MELRQQRNLGYKRKKGIGVRRSGAEEADSSRAPSIPRKLLAHIQIKSAPVPARSVASLRSSPLSVGLRCVADAPSLRAQFHFFTIPKAAPLRGLPWAIILSPRFAGLKIPLAYGSQTPLQLPIYRAVCNQLQSQTEHHFSIYILLNIMESLCSMPA